MFSFGNINNVKAFNSQIKLFYTGENLDRYPHIKILIF